MTTPHAGLGWLLVAVGLIATVPFWTLHPRHHTRTYNVLAGIGTILVVTGSVLLWLAIFGVGQPT